MLLTEQDTLLITKTAKALEINLQHKAAKRLQTWYQDLESRLQSAGQPSKSTQKAPKSR